MTTPNPNPPPPPPQTWLEKLGGKFVTLSIIFGIVGSGIAWSTGYIKEVYGWKVASDQAASQTSAMSERLTLLETSEKQRLVAMNAEAIATVNAANDLRNQIAEAQRLGQDVRDMKEQLRALELKTAELNTKVCFLTEECKKSERRRK